MKMRRALLMPLLLIGMMSGPLALAEEERQLDRYITLLRMDLKAQQAALVVNNMHFTESESEAFWSVYQQFQKDLSKVWDEKIALIKDYATHFDQVDDTKAKELIAKALGFEEQRMELIKKYIGEFGKVLPAKQVARFFQLEMQMQRMIDLQVAAELPLVK